MSGQADLITLRRRLKQLAEEFDTGLSRRYALEFPPEKPSLYRRLRTNAGRVLRWLGIMQQPPPKPPPPLEPWLTELKHVEYHNASRPVLIWAIGIGRDELRGACDRIRKSQTAPSGWAPVLVTDVADFAFFSRLKWLVEYVPSLLAPANGYSERKIRYLAWRYRDIPALSITAELNEDLPLEELLVE